jgi:hypothetical protein
MKTGTVLAATLALASLPLVAQQSAPEASPSSPSATQPNSPAGSQSTSPSAETGQPASTSAAPNATATPSTAAATASAADMRAVKGELISKLDTKTAKTGDDVVVQTKDAVKTADGTEIPKGSKLVGHVLAVQASGAGQNSQVVLRLDHAELQGGQSLPIESQIQAIGDSSSSESAGMSGASSASGSPSATGSSPAANNGASSGMNGASGNAGGASASASTPGSAQTPSQGTAGAASGSGPAAGTVVARTGAIAIRATSIPGVLLANNEPGQRDPRMAQASSILLGAKKDVELNSGTPMVVGVTAAASGTK